MSTMLLSIKPQYAKVILEGKKQYEFRKNKPKQNVTRIIFYASSPQKEVVGEAEIDTILEGTPTEIWEIAKTAAGITKKFFFSYYQGKSKAFAYKLKNVKVYDKPKSLLDYGLTQAPFAQRVTFGTWYIDLLYKRGNTSNIDNRQRFVVDCVV